MKVLISFLLLTQAFWASKTCDFFQKNRFLCYEFHRSDSAFPVLKSLEVFEQRNLCPLQAYYFFPDGKLMVYLDWKDHSYLRLDHKGQVLESLQGERYENYRDGELVSLCEGNRCESLDFDFVKIDPEKLEFGDAIFSGSINPYSGTGRAQFTHISFYLGKIKGVHQVLAGEMGEALKESPLEDSIYNTINVVVLRNKLFKKHFQEYYKRFQKGQIRRQKFCSDLFRDLYRKIFPKKSRNWTYFEGVHPEILLRNSFEDFQIQQFKLQSGSKAQDDAKLRIHTKSPGQENRKNREDQDNQTGPISKSRLKSFLESRAGELRKQVEEWDHILAQDDQALYEMFAKRFIFLPLVFNTRTVHEMLKLFQSGIFQLGRFPKESKAVSSHKTPHFSPKRTCHPLHQHKKLCLNYFASGNLKSIEIIEPKQEAPLQSFFFYPTRAPMSIFNTQFRFYRYFKQTGFMEEKLSDHRYELFDYSPHKPEALKRLLKCNEFQCEDKRFSFVSIPHSNLQTGDVIFSRNVFPYSARARAQLTHISIYQGVINGVPMVLSNDIHQKLNSIPLNGENNNTISYIALRNRQFTDTFKTFEKSKDKRDLPMPFFCSNLYVEIIKKIAPDLYGGWDAIDKNYVESLFLNSISIFEVQDFHFANGEFGTPKEFVQKRAKAVTRIRADIASIMDDRFAFFHSIFLKKFPLLPLSFDRNQSTQLLEFLKLNYPFDPKD